MSVVELRNMIVWSVLVMTLAALPVASFAGVAVFKGDDLKGFVLDGCKFSDGQIALAQDAGTRTDTDGPASGKTYRSGTASRVMTDAEPFDQIVLSWNAQTPKGTWVVLEARASVDGQWTEWFNLGYWALDGGSIERTSIKGQKSASGYVDCDTVFLSKKAQEAETRITLCSADPAASPCVELFAVDLASGGKRGYPIVPKSAHGVSLPVPELSQLDYPPRGNVWCSATSVTMVLNYWAEKLQRPEIATNVRDAAAAIHDKAWGGTGNWTFNTAYAGTREGIQAYCVRMSGYNDVSRWIKAGVPVILSISANILHNETNEPDAGHLIVCIGFDENGDAICNDPYANREKGQKVRRVYNRAKLLKAWAPSNRTAYLIYPEKLAEP